MKICCDVDHNWKLFFIISQILVVILGLAVAQDPNYRSNYQDDDRQNAATEGRRGTTTTPIPILHWNKQQEHDGTYKTRYLRKTWSTNQFYKFNLKISRVLYNKSKQQFYCLLHFKTYVENFSLFNAITFILSFYLRNERDTLKRPINYKPLLVLSRSQTTDNNSLTPFRRLTMIPS